MINRKRQVILTAQQLFIEKGFYATSIQDIINGSGISKGTFYNYFSSKNGFLIAVLEHANNEVSARRCELLINQSTSDKIGFSEQILVRIQVHHEYNLLPIFEEVFHSGDSDLKSIIKKNHLRELSWLASRLIDVYGKDVIPFASDCAVIAYGMMQNIMHIWTTSSKGEIDVVGLVDFTVRRLDSMIPDMIHTNDTFLGDWLLSYEDRKSNEEVYTKQQLLAQLTKISNKLEEDNMLPESKQYIQFIMEELQADCPREFILVTVIRSFREASVGMPYALKVQEVIANLWTYVNELRKNDKNT